MKRELCVELGDTSNVAVASSHRSFESFVSKRTIPAEGVRFCLVFDGLSCGLKSCFSDVKTRPLAGLPVSSSWLELPVPLAGLSTNGLILD